MNPTLVQCSTEFPTPKAFLSYARGIPLFLKKSTDGLDYRSPGRALVDNTMDSAFKRYEKSLERIGKTEFVEDADLWARASLAAEEKRKVDTVNTYAFLKLQMDQKVLSVESE